MDEAAPSPSGAWVDSKGNDVFSKTQAPYYIFQVLLVLYIVGFLGHLVLVQNATVPHTYNYQNNPGVLYSERFSSSYWFALMFSCMRIFLFITVCSLITYRKTQCVCGKPGNKGCSLFWTFMLVVFITFEVIVVALTGSFFKGCNVPGNANNPCNDLRYCHVPEVYNNQESGCTYQTPWNPPVMLSELRYNVDYLWLFSSGVVFLAADLVFLLFPVILWINTTSGQIRFSIPGFSSNTAPSKSVDFDVLNTQNDIIEEELQQKRERRKTKKKKGKTDDGGDDDVRQRKLPPPTVEPPMQETPTKKKVLLSQKMDKKE